MNSRRLIVQTGESSRELLFIGKLTVGRATECDISLNDGKVSRKHAELDATGPVPRITDLGSRNGMLVNNRKVTSAELEVGDVVVIGDARILVEAVVDEATAPAVEGIIMPPMPSPGPRPDPDPEPFPVPPMPPPAPPPEPPPPPAVMPPPSRTVPPAVTPSFAAPPPGLAAGSAGGPAHDEDDRTAVLPRPAAARPAAEAAPPPVEDDRTAVIPREAMPKPRPRPVAVPSPAVPAAEASAAPVAASSAAAESQIAQAPATGVPAPASAGEPAQAVPAAMALTGPRLSWGGMLMLLCVGLGALATLMAAVPLLSSSTQAIDALSTRQARTLSAWLADAAGRDALPTTADAALQTVLRQDGVADAMVLDASTGQVIAPIRLAGRSIDVLPGADGDWRQLAGSRVVAAGGSVDALAPFTRADRRHLAWVRYEMPSTSDQSLALVVALFGTMVLAFVASLLIRRHTAATLGLFTRQVELAVSGADVRVMQGGLLPGLDRLPGIVAYLLEQRKAGAAGAPGTAAAGTAGVASAPSTADDEPAWIEVTPSLSVTATSPHAPGTGIRNWASGARGRHLLDVLEPGAMSNAVVQGLGALSNAPGAAMTVPVEGASAVTLRRDAGGHVRIEMPMR